MRNKSKALAETFTISAKVLDAPVIPIVSGEAVCANGNLSINLNWPDDENSESFDIDRDGSILIANLADSQYADTSIATNNSYKYIVTARGPMDPGFAVSQTIPITTPEECEAPAPVAKITSFQLQAIETYNGTPQTTSRYPSFSGTTNIANAKINLILESGTIVYGAATANANGFWSWQSPAEMNLGSHTLYITATDPNDESIAATDAFHFEIVQETSSQTSGRHHNKKEASKKITLAPSSSPAPETAQSAPFTIAVSVKNPQREVYSGGDLAIQIDFLKKSSNLSDKEYDILYSAAGGNGNVISEISEKINPARVDSIEKNIPIPFLAEAGKYKITAVIKDGQNTISGEDFFQVKEFPIASVGSTNVSLTQIMQSLGWLSLLSLLIFLILLGIEYRQSEDALFQITENYLRRYGFFTKRKGVGR